MVGYKRKRAPARKPRMRKIARYARPQRNRFSVPVLKIQRTQWFENWSPNTVSTNGFWRFYTWNLQSVYNNGEFTNLFDQYKICALKFVFRPRYDNYAGNDTVDTTLPGVTNQGGTMLHIVNDPYSIVTPSGVYNSANLNVFFEQGNKVKTYNGNRAVSVYFKPTIRNTISGSSVNITRSKWINTPDAGIPHYGFHVFAQDVNLTGVFGQSFDVYVTTYIMCKNAR
jgi:hypothetical protein